MSNNSFKVKNSLTLTPVDLSQVVNPQAGDLACDINDSNKIKRYDANSAAWTEVGSGGVGGTDILFVQDFESASLSSFTQTGLSLSQTDPLHGKVSALLTHQAAINQSFKQVIAVDRKFRGEAMTMRLNVKSNAPAGDVTINIYDETNAANLVASEQLQLANDTSGVLNRIGFTIPETCASLSYTVTALPEAGSPVTRIDDIIAELAVTSLLETSVAVPVITGWQGYTPTFQGFGTPSAVEFEWRQVGEDVEIRGKFTAGTPTGVEARVGLPAGLTSAGTGLIPSLQQVGVYARGGVATSQHGSFMLQEPSTAYMTMSTDAFSGGSVDALAKVNGSSILTVGQLISITAKVPCAGLSATSTKTIPLTQSGLIQSADDYLLAQGNAAQAITASVTNVPFATVVTLEGNKITFAGSTFSVVEEGIYELNACVYLTTSTSRYMSLYGNGVFLRSVSSWTTASLVQGNISLKLTPGVSYSLRVEGTGGTLVNDPTVHYLIVSKQSPLKQVTVNPNSKITIPTSELRFEGASSRGSTATSIVRFDSVAKIRGDAFTVVSDAVNGTAITMTKAGKLDVSFSLLGSSTNGIVLSKNQTTLTTNSLPASEILALFNPSASGFGLSTSWSGFVAVGDIIRVAAASTPTANNGNQLNLSFQEQDIAVSVSNVLPQFSESDSSLRLSGANGFGSTNTLVRRFSSVLQNIGTDIDYVDSPTLGAQFTAKSAGIYNVSYSEQSNASASAAYVSLQINGTTVAIDGQQLVTAGTSDKPSSVSWSGYLASGDILTAAVASAAQSNGSNALFTISKVGKPNVTGVNVTPFVNVPQPEVQSTRITVGSQSLSSLNLNTLSQVSTGGSIYTVGTGFTVLKRCKLSLSFASYGSTTDLQLNILLNGTTIAFDRARNASALGSQSSCSISIVANPGDVITFSDNGVSAGGTTSVTLVAEAASDQIITASESFSTDTASLTYAPSSLYTLSTLNTAPVGTFITFTYAGGGNSRSQTTTAPTQTTADMNTNGILLYSRIYANGSTAAQPAAVAIQIGKGLKGLSTYGYKSTGKVTAASLDLFNESSTTQEGVGFRAYNENTGVLLIELGYCTLSTISVNRLRFEDGTVQNNGYLVINASKSPALVGVPLLQPRIATLSDVKASGTSGGSATAGSYQTRTLNTLSDPTGIVTSLASNQFTLPAGEYYIEATAPLSSSGAANPDTCKARIQNITDSTTAILGTSFRNANTGNTQLSTTISCSVSGVVVLSASRTFELQHRVGTTATNAFGQPTSFGDNEVYSIVKITKVK